MSDKAKHYTSAQTYKDDDGNMKNFTFIDHTVKTTIGGSPKLNQAELDEISMQRKLHKEELCNRIFAISASMCPMDFDDFVIRGEGHSKISWNQPMITDEGMDPIKRMFLCNILENRMDMTKKTY
jgi:hypothetical protein